MYTYFSTKNFFCIDGAQCQNFDFYIYTGSIEADVSELSCHSNSGVVLELDLVGKLDGVI